MPDFAGGDDGSVAPKIQMAPVSEALTANSANVAFLAKIQHLPQSAARIISDCNDRNKSVGLSGDVPLIAATD